jgi:Flp pilus assembly protein TadG
LKRIHRSWRPRRREHGASAVEFALVMPILLLLVFAIISYGFIFAQDLALGNAARQTARYGAVENRTCDDVKAEALSAASPLVDLNETGTVIEVKRGTAAGVKTAICATGTEQPCKGSADKDNVYVTLKFTADVLIPVVPGMGSTMQLTGDGVFRCEWF